MATNPDQDANDDFRLRLADLLLQLADDAQLSFLAPGDGSLTSGDWMADGGRFSLRLTPAHFQHAAWQLHRPYERFSRGLLTPSELAAGVLEAVQAMAQSREQCLDEFDERLGEREDADRISGFIAELFLDETDEGVRPFDLQSEPGRERFITRCRCTVALLEAFSTHHGLVEQPLETLRRSGSDGVFFS